MPGSQNYMFLQRKVEVFTKSFSIARPQGRNLPVNWPWRKRAWPLLEQEAIMTQDNKHTGSSLDEFLAEDGLLESSQSVAIKRVLSWQITQFMKKHKLSKATMAARMNSMCSLNSWRVSGHQSWGR
jgi:hypothetical protein